MSTTKIFQIGLITTVGVAGLAITANAQSRYGNIYDYESGHNCGQSCVAPAAPATTARYGAPVTQAPTYNPAPVYVDCTQLGTCAPQTAPVYTQPAPVYTQPAPVYTQTAGTTAQSDGTCLQSGSSYSTGTTYSEPTPSYSSGTTYASEPVSCPAGTTAQSDGTCLQSGSSYSTGSTYSTGTTYSEPTSSYSSGTTYASEPVNCPAGTTAQADGTCMQSGSAFTGSTVELYQGDASSNTNSSTGYGYTGGSYNAGDYLPVRK